MGFYESFLIKITLILLKQINKLKIYLLIWQIIGLTKLNSPKVKFNNYNLF